MLNRKIGFSHFPELSLSPTPHGKILLRLIIGGNCKYLTFQILQPSTTHFEPLDFKPYVIFTVLHVLINFISFYTK